MTHNQKPLDDPDKMDARRQKKEKSKDDNRFYFQFSNAEDRAEFEDWWNDYGYYASIEFFESKGMSLMFASGEHSETVTIIGEGEFEDE